MLAVAGRCLEAPAQREVHGAACEHSWQADCGGSCGPSFPGGASSAPRAGKPVLTRGSLADRSRGEGPCLQHRLWILALTGTGLGPPGGHWERDVSSWEASLSLPLLRLSLDSEPLQLGLLVWTWL